MRNIPMPAWYCLTAAFLGVVGAYVILSATGTDATEFRSFLNTVLNLAALVLGGGSLVYSGKAAQQTNGDLDARIQTAVTVALGVQRAEDTEPGGELRR